MKEDKKRTLIGKAAIVAKAKAAILKVTNQKPLQPAIATLPHVSSGSFPVDMLIGGNPLKDGKGLICPGFPRRRITELFGAESSGKTTLLISAMIQAQKVGGIAMFIDFEHSLDHAYAKALGLSYDDDKLLVYQPESMEDGFKMLFVGIAAGFDIIGVDSVAAMVPKDEMQKGFDDAAKIGIVARLLATALPKFVLWLQKYPRLESNKEAKDTDHPGTAVILVNQTRALINTGGYGGHGGGDDNTSGGKALKFFAYLRLRMARVKSEFIERKDPMTGKKRRFPYGNVTDVKVIKSKIDAKQGHSSQIFIRYGTGIDDYYSIIATGVVQKVIKREGNTYVLGEHKFTGRDKFRQFLVENPKVYDALRVKLMQVVNILAVNEEPDEGDELIEGFDLESDTLDSDIEAEVGEVLVTASDASEEVSDSSGETITAEG